MEAINSVGCPAELGGPQELEWRRWDSLFYKLYVKSIEAVTLLSCVSTRHLREENSRISAKVNLFLFSIYKTLMNEKLKIRESKNKAILLNICSFHELLPHITMVLHSNGCKQHQLYWNLIPRNYFGSLSLFSPLY